ncbi:hypothetical protein A0H81_11318 [Grifola frondosa]|uniref:Uncharacterized protein n=1 Tax=Grifola frondosa TaxID=5627 RepID=A0A1C7LW54_GRIFR|nr:hypothetical protein A0H81_11318 [Grifola frondosa]
MRFSVHRGACVEVVAGCPRHQSLFVHAALHTGSLGTKDSAYLDHGHHSIVTIMSGTTVAAVIKFDRKYQAFKYSGDKAWCPSLRAFPHSPALAAAASTAVRATPIADGPTQNDVFNPHITFPTAGVTWLVGSDQVVTWNTSSIPASNANQTGLILLGYLENDSENLGIDNPLATGFPIPRAPWVSLCPMSPLVMTTSSFCLVIPAMPPPNSPFPLKRLT